MLQTFTEDNRLREQYRLHEEFLRVQRTDQARTENLNIKYIKEKQAKEKALKSRNEALKSRDKERLEKEEALKVQQASLREVEKIKQSSIQFSS